MSQVLQQTSKTTDIEWWKTSRSLPEIAEHLERALKEKQELQHRYAELLQENRQLSSRCAKADAELTAERLLRSEEALQANGRVEGRQQAQLAAREKLLRDEFERKVQDLQLELNKERHLLAKRFEKMKAEAAGCICRGNSNHSFEDTIYTAQPKALRITYR